MKSKEIQKQIDRVVGTEGTLRIPSWWMHKILSDLVKYCQDNKGAFVIIKEYVESQLNLVGKTIEDLDTRLEDIESHELFEIVSELPSEPKDNTIYLIPSQNGEGNNVLTEWVYINGTWEQFGEFKADIDLSEYAKKEALNELSEEIAKKQDALVSGENIKTINGQSLVGDGNIEINTDTPDWDAEEGEDGYIKNRTHYLEYLEAEFATDGDEQYVSLGTECYIIYEKNIKKMVLEEGKNQISSGPPTYLNVKIEKGRGIATLEDAYEYHLSYPIYLYSGCRTLNEVFIPDTIREGANLGATAIQEVKTINGESIVGKGNIEIGGSDTYVTDFTIWNLDEMLDDNPDLEIEFDKESLVEALAQRKRIIVPRGNNEIGYGVLSGYNVEESLYLSISNDEYLYILWVENEGNLIVDGQVFRYNRMDFATKEYVDNAIATAITNELNTAV